MPETPVIPDAAEPRAGIQTQVRLEIIMDSRSSPRSVGNDREAGTARKLD
jgi:hypothetical protein